MVDRRYPKVLLISDATWSEGNNIGNTFSNLFGDWDSASLAMIYARGDIPDSSVCSSYFQIAESRLFRNLFKKSVRPGIEISSMTENKQVLEDEESGKRIYSFFKRYRWSIFLLARELLWKLGRWQTDELDRFIDDFGPDVVFVLASEGLYMNSIQRYAIERSKSSGAIYFVDDVYSLRRFSLSPLFWVNRLLSRRSLERTVSTCKGIYTIVDKQKMEYDLSFKQETVILNKGGYFKGEGPDSERAFYPLKLIYTGNIFAGRWKTLGDIGRSLDTINRDGVKAELFIYSKNELEKGARELFDSCESVYFMGGIAPDKVASVQADGDILVHVESFDRREKLTTRLSLSTKLVDYFQRGKCILAIGWEEASSIEYLKSNDIAFVVEDTSDLDRALGRLIDDLDLIRSYGEKSWKWGREHHDIDAIREKVYREMLRISES